MSAMTTDKLERTLVSQFLAKGFPEMQARLEAGIRVLDVGCGNGTASLLLAKAFPKSTFVGLDISAEGVAKGTTSAAEAGLGNVSFVCGDAATMHTDPVTIKALGGAGSFQYITAFDAIHDQVRTIESMQQKLRSTHPCPCRSHRRARQRRWMPSTRCWQTMARSRSSTLTPAAALLTTPSTRLAPFSTAFLSSTACPSGAATAALAWAPCGAAPAPRPCSKTPSLKWWPPRSRPPTRSTWSIAAARRPSDGGGYFSKN